MIHIHQQYLCQHYSSIVCVSTVSITVVLFVFTLSASALQYPCQHYNSFCFHYQHYSISVSITVVQYCLCFYCQHQHYSISISITVVLFVFPMSASALKYLCQHYCTIVSVSTVSISITVSLSALLLSRCHKFPSCWYRPCLCYRYSL